MESFVLICLCALFFTGTKGSRLQDGLCDRQAEQPGGGGCILLLVLVFPVLAAGYDLSFWLFLSIALSEHVRSLACLRASILRGKALFLVVFALYRNQMVFLTYTFLLGCMFHFLIQCICGAILKHTESPRVAVSATHLNWGYFVN